jgi:phosphohistidine phosphatase SixA
MQRLFVGRHGRDNKERYNEYLLPEGVDDAHRMAERLKNLGIGRRTILLSSSAPRAVETAGIIKVDLQAPTLVRSPFVFRAEIIPSRSKTCGALRPMCSPHVA